MSTKSNIMNEQPWKIAIAEEIFGDISGEASSATEHTAQGPSIIIIGELIRAGYEDGIGHDWEDGDEEDDWYTYGAV
jgi:hypothetical protein